MDATERRRRVVDLYAQGLSVQAAAAAVGCHSQTARADIRAAGLEVRGTNKPQTAPRVCAREGCERLFRPSPRQLRSGFGRFCSRECDHEAHRLHPKPEPRVCAREGCDTTFTPTAANAAGGWGKFCSRRCSALSTGAHRRAKGRMISCRECGAERWRYESQLRGEHGWFCSQSCWGKRRWRLGIAISDDVVTLATGRARQEWKGRWNGHMGGLDGREGGRPSKATPEQAAEVWRLHRGGLSSRAIAAGVFGDARYYRRVIRIVGQTARKADPVP